MLILGVVIAPLLATPYRKWKGCTAFDSEQNNKLRLDVATLVPVGVLLWNLLVYYLVNAFTSSHASALDAAGRAAQPLAVAAISTALTFEKAIAAAGESTVALATAIIFCRLFGGIWADIHK
jgi:hypothetical protein